MDNEATVVQEVHNPLISVEEFVKLNSQEFVLHPFDGFCLPLTLMGDAVIRLGHLLLDRREKVIKGDLPVQIRVHLSVDALGRIVCSACHPTDVPERRWETDK